MPVDTEPIKYENNSGKFLQALQSGQEVDYRRTKIMFIGKGRSGKTSTIRSLLHQTFDANEESTRAARQQDIEVGLTAADNWKEKANNGKGHIIGDDFVNFSRYRWDEVESLKDSNTGTRSSGEIRIETIDLFKQLREKNVPVTRNHKGQTAAKPRDGSQTKV